jgi:hypothetical protein
MSKNSGALPGPGAQTGSIEFSLTLPSGADLSAQSVLIQPIEEVRHVRCVTGRFAFTTRHRDAILEK